MHQLLAFLLSRPQAGLQLRSSLQVAPLLVRLQRLQRGTGVGSQPCVGGMEGRQQRVLLRMASTLKYNWQPPFITHHRPQPCTYRTSCARFRGGLMASGQLGTTFSAMVPAARRSAARADA